MRETEWIAAGVFLLCYTLFVLLPKHRASTAAAGAAALVITGTVGLQDALTQKIHWNVIGLFMGTLVLADLFMQSRAPAAIAGHVIARTRTVRGATLAICTLSGLLSMFVENVAVVLVMAPIALSVARKLDTSPVPTLILIAVSSNLQGTATLIGDPPSMILADHMHMNFVDFFVYRGRPGIFWPVQAGAVCALAIAAYLLRREVKAVVQPPDEPVRSWVPSVLLVAFVITLSFASLVDPDFKWFAGALAVCLATGGVLWMRLGPRWQSVRAAFRAMDWDTGVFLAGIFVIVGVLSETGLMGTVAGVIARIAGNRPLAAFLTVTLTAVAVSAFVDNVPFLLAMLPVVQKVADTAGIQTPLLLFGLLIGSCLGGNITPIGASANIVAVGICRKQGFEVSFQDFVAIGLPFTIAAVVGAGTTVWLLWGR